MVMIPEAPSSPHVFLLLVARRRNNNRAEKNGIWAGMSKSHPDFIAEPDDSDFLGPQYLEKWNNHLTFILLLIGQWQNSVIRKIKKLVVHKCMAKWS